MRIAVLAGGRSSEHEISRLSGAAVAEGLREFGHQVAEVVIEQSGVWSVGPEEVVLRPGGGLLDVDVVFPILHGPFGEDGSIQGLLECLDVPYAGSDVLSSALCMDKLSLKRVLGFHGIPQVGFVEAGEEGWRETVAEMGLPVWVKPSRLGSSVGISRVDSLDQELDKAVELALRHDPRVIVEAPARGREVECSLLGNEDPMTSPPGEIVIDSDWYDFESKYTEGGMKLAVPADLPQQTIAEVETLARRVFLLAGCSGLARCDFFVEPDGEVLVNEINTIPGFTKTSVYAKLLEAGGITYPDLCNRLADLAIERHRRARSHQF